MNLNELTAITPVDGRYRNKVDELAPYFSEFALIKNRLAVEVYYFQALCQMGISPLNEIDLQLVNALSDIVSDFDEEDAQRIKTIENTTNHDVKAVEYFLKEKFDERGLTLYKEFIHFGLTSQDINNTSFPMMWKQALDHVVLPALNSLVEMLNSYATEWENIPMLARTHGQPASPTRLGKEIRVFAYRLETQMAQLLQTPISGKFGGATGNFNAHKVSYPQVDWTAFGNEFLASALHIEREQYTTQISNYDNFAASFDAFKRINTVLLDLCKDVWQYVSMEYFKQRIKAGEVGSSAMPHKVNPIDFENAEGNLGIANALLEHFAAKLPISRLQRDLTDSTVIRNIGTPLAHLMIAIKSIQKGFGKLLLNEEPIQHDLENNWAVVAEGIQTILRREGYPNPYEALKALTRTNTHITKETIHAFIDTLEVSDAIKSELKQITPSNYTGI